MKEEIRQYLSRHAATGEANGSFSDQESLLEAGVIDSMTMVDLIAHLEKSYGIAVDEDDMTPENFDTVDGIVDYVRRMQEQCRA